MVKKCSECEGKDLEKISSIFSIKKNDVISLVGAGGKTSLMYFLANKLNGKKLITTTTKIYKPDNYTVIIDEKIKNTEDIYVSAKKEEFGDKVKICGLNPKVNFDDFDYILIEADGARKKSIKGWSESEPVIVNNTTITCGIIDISVIGKKVNQLNIFRLEELKKITKMSKEITINNLRDIILHPNGLFKNALGKNVLYINKIENDNFKNSSNKLLDLLLKKSVYKLCDYNQLKDKILKLDKIIVGSIKKEKFEIKCGRKLYERHDNC